MCKYLTHCVCTLTQYNKYSLYVDLVINCIMLGVIGLELLISIWCIISFARAS
jgi:hypothetical protein